MSNKVSIKERMIVLAGAGLTALVMAGCSSNNLPDHDVGQPTTPPTTTPEPTDPPPTSEPTEPPTASPEPTDPPPTSEPTPPPTGTPGPTTPPTGTPGPTTPPTGTPGPTTPPTTTPEPTTPPTPPSRGFDYIKHSGVVEEYPALDSQDAGAYQLANRNVFENPEQAGNRQAELAAAIFNFVADFSIGQDLEVLGLDVDGLQDTPELRQAILEAAVVSIAHHGNHNFDRDVIDALFDQTNTFVSRGARNNIIPDAGVACDRQELVDGQDYNLTDRADTMLVVGSGKRVFVPGEDDFVEGAEINGVTRCSRPSIVATDYSVTGFVPYVYWMSEDEYRTHLYTVAPEHSASEIEERVQTYRGLIDAGIAQPGETITGIADNANAASGVAGVFSAARFYYPDLNEHELLAAAIVSAEYENMTLNGEAVGAGNNGAGLGYNKTHAGFGMFTSASFYQELDEMNQFKEANSGQVTTPKRVSVTGGEFVQLWDNQEAIYPMIVEDEITAYRMMLDIELEEPVPEGVIPTLQIISPTGATYDYTPSVNGNKLSISTDEVFALQGQGYWWLSMGQGLKPVDSKVNFTLAGVETGGFVDQYLATKNIGDDSVLGVGRTLDHNTALERVLRIVGNIVGSVIDPLLGANNDNGQKSQGIGKAQDVAVGGASSTVAKRNRKMLRPAIG